MRSAMIAFLLGIAVLTCCGLVFLGCSSDDNPSSGVQGNINDPDFIAVHDELGDFVDSTLAWFQDGLGSMTGLSSDTTVDPVKFVPTGSGYITDTASSDYTTDGWHIVYLGFHSDDYLGFLRDSIQFSRDGIAQKSASRLDKIIFTHLRDLSPVDTTVDFKSFNSYGNMVFEGLNTYLATLNGTQTLHTVTKDVTANFKREITITSDLSNFKIYKGPTGSWEQFCPSSGTITATIDMVYQKGDAAPDTTQWSLTLTFDEGTAQSTLTAGQVYWNYSSQECVTPGN